MTTTPLVIATYFGPIAVAASAFVMLAIAEHKAFIKAADAAALNRFHREQHRAWDERWADGASAPCVECLTDVMLGGFGGGPRHLTDGEYADALKRLRRRGQAWTWDTIPPPGWKAPGVR